MGIEFGPGPPVALPGKDPPAVAAAAAAVKPERGVNPPCSPTGEE